MPKASKKKGAKEADFKVRSSVTKRISADDVESQSQARKRETTSFKRDQHFFQS
jgi:hypothetical protein